MTAAKKTLADYPELVAQWDFEKNGKMRPADVAAASKKKVHWKCPVADDHRWESRVASRTNGRGCPCCAGKKIVKSNCLAVTHPEIAAQLLPFNLKTGEPQIADKIIAYSHKRYWWFCPVTKDHIWEVQVLNRTYNGNGCPCCVGQKVVSSNCLAVTHPEIAAQLLPHNLKTGEPQIPEKITAGSQKKYWWKCPVAEDHRWEATVSHRTNGRGCPCCAGKKIVKSNCLATTHPELAAQLLPFNLKTGTPQIPEKITAGSGRKYWWQCPEYEYHTWESTTYNRKGGRNCPFCDSSKGEELIKKILENKSVTFKRQWRTKDLGKLSFDFAIIVKKVVIALIEYQGEQHYYPVRHGGISEERAEENFSKQIIRDIIKVKYCQDKKIPFLAVHYLWDKKENKIEYELTKFLAGLGLISEQVQ